MKGIFTNNSDRTTLRIHPKLAEQIGLNESIILLQIDYLIKISKTEMKENRSWTYQSIRSLQKEYFPFWSIATINRTLQKLESEGYIKTSNYNKYKYDKTRWITIEYDKVSTLKQIIVAEAERVFQNDTPFNQNETRSDQNETTIPKTPTETPTELKNDDDSKNPFVFYEQNIGMLTMYISDTIKDSIAEWEDHKKRLDKNSASFQVSGDRAFFEAAKLAVKNEKRTMRYILAILRNWMIHGYGWKPTNLKAKRTDEDKPEQAEQNKPKQKQIILSN